MKYALIGCGRVAPNHIKAAKENGMEIVAVCDISNEHIEQLFERAELSQSEIQGIHRYNDYRELLENETPELISIALPSGLHAECAQKVIEKNINVIIEKPIAMSLKDADRIIELAQKHGVVVSACHQNRFNKAVREMRSALENGSFGKISHGAITVRWSRGKDYYDQADWRGKWASDGGTLMNQCIHGIDLLRWMCSTENSDIVKVYGTTKRRLHDYIEAEDVGMAVLEFADGVIATVEGTVNVNGKNLEEHLSLFGENGSVKLGGMSANTVEHWSFEGVSENDKEINEHSVNVYGNGHTSLFADVKQAIENRTSPYVDALAGRKALETVLAIYLSSARGEPVELPLKDVSSEDFQGLFDR